MNFVIISQIYKLLVLMNFKDWSLATRPNM